MANDNLNDKLGKSLSGNLFDLLQQDILSGKIKAGSKITEQSICKQYNVSRTPVREALRQLEIDGLIENIPNRGAFAIGLSKRDVSDLFDLRGLFEAQAVEWAIRRISEEEVEKLGETIEFMEFYTIKQDVEKVMQFNTQFHDIIYKATGNRKLYNTLSSYQTYLKYSAPPKAYNEEDLTTILAEHRAIHEAFLTGNVKAGKAAMQKHMQESKNRRISNYF
jgi:DNA-binding GntR family transcriptional regulator